MLAALALTWMAGGAVAPPPSFILTDAKGTLRGDWVAPASVVVAHSKQWPSTLDGLVSAVGPNVKVLVVHEYDASLGAAVDWWRELDPEIRSKTFLLNVEVSTPWLRDFGPFVREADAESTWVDAAIESSRPDDDALVSRLARRWGADVEPLDRWVDGGAVVSNGAGLCATVGPYFSEHAPPRSDGEGQRQLFAALGCRGVAYLPGVEGDSTDHADVTVQFLAPEAVVVADSERPEDHARLDQTVHTLQRAASRVGSELEVHRVPSRYQRNGRYLSYVNALQLEDRVLVPSYGPEGDELDAAARRAWQRAVGDEVEVISVAASRPAALGGALHCLTLGLGRARQSKTR